MWDQVERALNQSTTQVLSQLASILPGFAALLLAILVSTAIAWALSFLLRRVMGRFEFDDLLRRWGFAALREWSPSESPSLLLARIVFWSVVLLGVLIGIAALDASLTSQLVLQLFTYLPNVVAAVLVLLLGNIIARFLARSVLIGAVNLNLQYARLISTGVKWMILVLAVAMALDHLAIGGSIVHIAFGILFGGIVLALALAVGLGSKELVSRSLEREANKRQPEVEEPFRHL
jgi:mechanosensitive ion channel-like protein